MVEPDTPSEVDAPFTLRRRKRAVPGDLRILRRVGLVTLLLEACRDSRASLEQLHVLNWAVRSKESREAFLSFMAGAIAPDQAIVRYDPTLSRALDFARHEQLVQDRAEPQEAGSSGRSAATSYRVALTEKGRQLAAILADDDYLVDERLFLDSIGRKVTQKMVEALFSWR
jgi:hypothetical protein